MDKITKSQLHKDLEQLKKFSGNENYKLLNDFNNWAVYLDGEQIVGFGSKRETHDAIWAILKFIWHNNKTSDNSYLFQVEIPKDAINDRLKLYIVGSTMENMLATELATRFGVNHFSNIKVKRL